MVECPTLQRCKCGMKCFRLHSSYCQGVPRHSRPDSRRRHCVICVSIKSGRARWFQSLRTARLDQRSFGLSYVPPVWPSSIPHSQLWAVRWGCRVGRMQWTGRLRCARWRTPASLLFSPGVCYGSARSLALKDHSSTCRWSQWRQYASACAAVTRSLRDSCVPKPISCFYKYVLPWCWDRPREEGTTNALPWILKEENANTSIWRHSKRP